MLGNKIYFLDFKNKKIGEGIVVQAYISTGGYESYVIQTENGDVTKEQTICFDTLKKAEKAMKRKQPLADKINTLAKKTTDKIDGMREKLLGKPELKHLARR